MSDKTYRIKSLVWNDKPLHFDINQEVSTADAGLAFASVMRAGGVYHGILRYYTPDCRGNHFMHSVYACDTIEDAKRAAENTMKAVLGKVLEDSPS